MGSHYNLSKKHGSRRIYPLVNEALSLQLLRTMVEGITLEADLQGRLDAGHRVFAVERPRPLRHAQSAGAPAPFEDEDGLSSSGTPLTAARMRRGWHLHSQ